MKDLGGAGGKEVDRKHDGGNGNEARLSPRGTRRFRAVSASASRFMAGARSEREARGGGQAPG
ncbi:hypothetical protein, partial [Streptomyces lonarensis]|uniref:hypothetical protein n=1 Tax=Streptomyces lonarensis TaxID=700599 RepID=UPI0030C7771F